MSEAVKKPLLESAFMIAAHDVKNSLGVLLELLDSLPMECGPQRCPSSDGFANVEYEVRRINGNLLKILTLYKFDNARYMVCQEPWRVRDQLEELDLEYRRVLGGRGIEIEIDCPQHLFGYFDRNLIQGVLGGAVANAFRYARQRLHLTATEQDGGVMVRVEDDGEGYPDDMLANAVAIQEAATDFIGSNTGLGLYFTAVVVSAHTNNGVRGRMALGRSPDLGGACFEIWLP